MTAEYAVELRDVVKKFITPEGNELNAVDHVTMQIKNGEFFSMLGSSGCGKTTSLRMIAGFEWHTEGEVYIEGKAMGHCVGSYGSRVTDKSVIIRSLQDKDGLPVATFELSANGKTIMQLKGPKNGPIDPDYHKILQKYIKDEGLKFNTGGGYGSGDYKFIGLESPDLSKLKLDEATSRKKSDDEDAPKRTRFADKASFKDLNFGKRDDKLPSAPKKDDKESSDGWQEKTVKLNKASADDTRKAMKDVKLDLQS